MSKFSIAFETFAEFIAAATKLGLHQPNGISVPSAIPTAVAQTMAPPPPAPPAPAAVAPVAPPPPAGPVATSYTDPSNGATYTLQHVQTALQGLGNNPAKGGPAAVQAILKKYNLTSLTDTPAHLLPLLYNDAVA